MRRLFYLLYLIGFGASAGIYKCQDVDGKIKYQGTPCPYVISAKKLDIEELPPGELLRLQNEERRVDLRMEAYKRKKVLWDQRDYQRLQNQMRIYAINQSIVESMQMREEQLKAERRAGSRRYYPCRRRHSSLSKCNRFD